MRASTRSCLALGLLIAALELDAQVANGPVSFASGGRQTAGAVVNDAALGSFGGIATAGTFVARHGFAAQLTEARSVSVSAGDPNLNETASTQLQAGVLLDDDTTLSLDADAVAWSIASGPLAAINSAGVATAGTVHTDATAVARADYHGGFGTLELLVVNVGIDNFGSYAGDGIDDAWQVGAFGLDNALAAASADPDGDERDNLSEYVAGTLPTDAASRFTLELNGSTRDLTLSPIVAGRTYAIEFRDAFGAGNFAELTGTTEQNANGVRTITDPTATTSRFYRVKISLP